MGKRRTDSSLTRRRFGCPWCSGCRTLFVPVPRKRRHGTWTSSRRCSKAWGFLSRPAFPAVRCFPPARAGAGLLRGALLHVEPRMGAVDRGPQREREIHRPPVPELYDLASDPQESRNLFSERRERAAELKRLLPRVSAALSAEPAGAEEVRRLRALGYLAGSARAKSVYAVSDDPKNLVALDNRIHRVVDLFQTDRVREATAIAREVVRERPTMAVGYEFLAFLLQHQGRDFRGRPSSAGGGRRGIAPRRCRSASPSSSRRAAARRTLSESCNPWRRARTRDAERHRHRARGLREVRRRPPCLRTDPRDGSGRRHRPPEPGDRAAEEGRCAGRPGQLRPCARDQRQPSEGPECAGVALANRGDAAAAVASWQRAVELDPRQYDALLNIGIVAGRSGNRAIAREALRRFVAPRRRPCMRRISKPPAGSSARSDRRDP